MQKSPSGSNPDFGSGSITTTPLEKKSFSDREQILKFEAEGREFAKF